MFRFVFGVVLAPMTKVAHQFWKADTKERYFIYTIRDLLAIGCLMHYENSAWGIPTRNKTLSEGDVKCCPLTLQLIGSDTAVRQCPKMGRALRHFPVMPVRLFLTPCCVLVSRWNSTSHILHKEILFPLSVASQKAHFSQGSTNRHVRGPRSESGSSILFLFV